MPITARQGQEEQLAAIQARPEPGHLGRDYNRLGLPVCHYLHMVAARLVPNLRADFIQPPTPFSQFAD